MIHPKTHGLDNVTTWIKATLHDSHQEIMNGQIWRKTMKTFSYPYTNAKKKIDISRMIILLVIIISQEPIYFTIEHCERMTQRAH